MLMYSWLIFFKDLLKPNAGKGFGKYCCSMFFELVLPVCST